MKKTKIRIKSITTTVLCIVLVVMIFITKQSFDYADKRNKLQLEEQQIMEQKETVGEETAITEK